VRSWPQRIENLTGSDQPACDHGGMPAGTPISQRALGRALLARQLLLERVARPAAEVVEDLVTLQAQVPVDPYVALWTRLAAFDPQELSGLLETRRVARAPLLRATIHLGTARDLLRIRPLVAPVLERNFRSGSPFGRRLPGVDMEEVLGAARATSTTVHAHGRSCATCWGRAGRSATRTPWAPR
jgi:hypothetical protein